METYPGGWNDCRDWFYHVPVYNQPGFYQSRAGKGFKNKHFDRFLYRGLNRRTYFIFKLAGTTKKIKILKLCIGTVNKEI